ncbi:MAG TPA: AraC family transcriptional regulator [Cyanobacteria bacterium UBA8553]|nr:AraC family transcriptional regulator [Cyanobacteria bacterium UBA8553]HAJ60960.1 AraC family transcriptional regulator [Cyanobacteria bacterium UBA8543]
MANASHHNTKSWLLPEFNNLELFRAEAIHHTYARHSHQGYSIGIIEAGVGGNCYRGSTYFAPPGSVIFMNPEEVHTGYSVDDLPLTYRMLYPSVDLIQQLAGEMPAYEFPYFKEAVVQDEVLAKNIGCLHIALEQLQDQLEQQSLLVEVFSAILAGYANIQIRPVQLGKEQRIIRLIKEYLHDNFNSSISLRHLVELTNLNRSYLIRVFRNTVGMPPYTYLNQIRVEKAKQLLSQGLSIADVAIAVGMSDQSHLTRHFKRIVGITPGRYRSMSISFKTNQS